MTTYAPDVAPELEPKVVRWLPAHPSGRAHAHLLSPEGAALALVVLAALALGAAAAGALAVGGAHRRPSRYRLLDLDGLGRRLQLRRRPF